MAVQTWIYGQPDIRYEGCVLDKYEHNGYHDSYFYAICWDDERQEIVKVEYDTTAAGGGGYADVDATEETLRKVYRYLKKQGKVKFDGSFNPDQAKAFGRGDMVKVVRGRKIPKGSTGEVFWVGERYNVYAHRPEKRVGVEIDGERVFLPYEYVERMDWEKYLITGKERKKRIRNYAIKSLPANFRKGFERCSS